MQRLLQKTVLNSLLILTGIFSGWVFAADATPQPESYPLPVHYSGRVVVEKSDQLTSYTYSWPGVYFEAEFNGSDLDIRLNDANNILNLIIDDKEPIVLTQPGKKTHSLKNLGKGPHKVRLEKRTETIVGTGTFEGFYVPTKDSVLKPVPRQRKMEFIGDSFSVGYGNMSSSRECDNDEIFRTTNTQQAFSALTAKHFNADYQINAISGSGVVRNYNGAFPDKNFRLFYPYTLLDVKNSEYKDSWAPDVIVLELGGNDFATPLNPGEKWSTREALQDDFVKSYAAFILELRKKNPQASFIVLVPPARSDELLQQHKRVIEQLKTEGEVKVHLLSADPMELSSCQWHPSLKDHQTVSQLLIDFINANPQLWVSKKR